MHNTLILVNPVPVSTSDGQNRIISYSKTINFDSRISNLFKNNFISKLIKNFYYFNLKIPLPSS